MMKTLFLNSYPQIPVSDYLVPESHGLEKSYRLHYNQGHLGMSTQPPRQLYISRTKIREPPGSISTAMSHQNTFAWEADVHPLNRDTETNSFQIPKKERIQGTPLRGYEGTQPGEPLPFDAPTGATVPDRRQRAYFLGGIN
ncbi:MAG TPA: hypothetical protein VJ327_03250 [Patescibacteria group bacterium]|nr:hypothetical protein [Patescibacteria group bacterium]